MKRDNISNSSNRSNKKKVYNFLGGAALAAALTFGGGSLLSSTSSPTYAQSSSAAILQAATPGTGTPSTSTPAATQNANGTTSNAAPDGDNDTAGAPGGKGRHGGPGDKGGPGGPGGRGGEGGPGGLQGTITSINGSTITLKRDNVVNIIGTVNSTTTYTQAGKTINLSDLKTGELVQLHETRNTDGSFTITSVAVVLSHAGGTVSAVSADSLTITHQDNSTQKVNLTSATTYMDLGKTISLADIKNGIMVEAQGMLNADGSLNAEVINVRHDQLGGVVTAISGNTITVQGGGRGDHAKDAQPGAVNPAPSTTATTRTITISDSTTFLQAGQSAKLSNIVVGARIEAAGTLSTDGNSLIALQVNLQLPGYRGQVTAVSGNTITLQDRGTTRTVVVDSNTKFLNGTAAASLSDVKAGVSLEAEGQLDSAGKLMAVVIQLGQAAGPRGH